MIRVRRLRTALLCTVCGVFLSQVVFLLANSNYTFLEIQNSIVTQKIIHTKDYSVSFAKHNMEWEAIAGNVIVRYLKIGMGEVLNLGETSVCEFGIVR